MNNTETHRYGNDFYGWLWASTIGLGLIGLMFAHHYIGQVTADPQNSEVYLSDFKDWVSHGSLLFIVLFYFYFKALGYGLNNQRYIRTFIKLTIWSVVVVLVKIVIVGGLHAQQGVWQLDAYMLAAITHLSYVATFGLFIFPATTLYMIIKFIRHKLKGRISKKQETVQIEPIKDHRTNSKSPPEPTIQDQVGFLLEHWWMIALIIIGLSAGATTLGKWG